MMVWLRFVAIMLGLFVRIRILETPFTIIIAFLTFPRAIEYSKVPVGTPDVNPFLRLFALAEIFEASPRHHPSKGSYSSTRTPRLFSLRYASLYRSSICRAGFSSFSMTLGASLIPTTAPLVDAKPLNLLLNTRHHFGALFELLPSVSAMSRCTFQPLSSLRLLVCSPRRSCLK